MELLLLLLYCHITVAALVVSCPNLCTVGTTDCTTAAVCVMLQRAKRFYTDLCFLTRGWRIKDLVLDTVSFSKNLLADVLPVLLGVIRVFSVGREVDSCGQDEHGARNGYLHNQADIPRVAPLTIIIYNIKVT